MPQPPLPVSFVSADLAESEADLIVAFAITPLDDPMGLENLILMRTPKYEGLLPPEERGVLVTYDGNAEDERGYLRTVTLDEGVAQVQTASHLYTLNLKKVDPAEIELMLKALRRMNFDSIFQITGV